MTDNNNNLQLELQVDLDDVVEEKSRKKLQLRELRQIARNQGEIQTAL